MDNLEIISKSPEDTIKIAINLAKLLTLGDTIILTGELGAGKTKFTEGFLSYFNIEDEISSPTFNIINEYHTQNLNIYHFDVYRLEDIEEFYAIGGDEYFRKGICLIEWGETIKDALPEDYISITFSQSSLNENTRIISFKSFGTKYNNILSQFKEELN